MKYTVSDFCDKIPLFQFNWIILTECSKDEDCKEYYPDHPLCDIKDGRCVKYPNNLQAPKIFDTLDVCKKLYGNIFVYDRGAMTCRIPKCQKGNDYCPKPSKCWRGTFISLGTYIYQ